MKMQRTPCVFIADDNPNNLKVLSTMLESKGYDTRVAIDGEQTLASIRQSSPDLLLLDIHMPKMDGYEVCRAIKKDKALKDLRIIFISSLTEPFNKIKGFRLGAADYIEKPFQIEEVEVRVEAQLQLRYYQQQLKKRTKISEERLRIAAEASNIGIWEWQVDTDTLLWDERMFNHYGIEKSEFIEKSATWFDLIHKEDQARVKDELKRSLFENKTFKSKFKILRPDRTIRHFSVKAGVYPAKKNTQKKLVGVTLDITDQVIAEKNSKKLEDQLRQSQKMESIGTLAGGIAHDFNNILSAIIGYTQLVMSGLPDTSTNHKKLANVINASTRAEELVKQILTFSRKEEQEFRPLKIQLVVKEALKLLRSSIPSTIRIKQNIPDDGDMVLADPTQIHQVIMNICTNSYQAMKNTGGVLDVSLRQVELDHKNLAGKLYFKPGSYLRIKISDTGSGIPKNIQDKIFEPYFTTKKRDEGTGLGLAVVHGIVKGLKGYITVDSESGHQTIFRIFLPVISALERTVVNDLLSEIPMGHERILFVDDDEILVDVNKEMLKDLGYHVTALSNSLEAGNLFQNSPDSFDLIITDMTMPELTGDKLAERILKIRPGMPIILSTGNSHAINPEMARSKGIKGYLTKPSTKRHLAEEIRRCLDENKKR